jgi:hypothetical protein
LDKPKILGILGGLIVFILIILVFILIYSDFDQQLILLKETGTPSNELINKIQTESKIEKLQVKNHLMEHVLDENYWSKPSLASPDDFNYYTDIYNKQIETINQCENIRKEFLYNHMPKKEFLTKIKALKLRLES